MRNGRLEKTFIAIAATGFAARSGILSYRSARYFNFGSEPEKSQISAFQPSD